MNKYLAFDIGGTNIKYGIFDNGGTMIEHNYFQTPKTREQFQAAVNNVINQYRNDIRGVTFSIPGRIDQSTSTIYGGGALTYNHGYPIDQLLDLEGLEFAIENDAKVSILAETWLGQLKDYTNGASIVLGTGIGGGLLLNGQLYRGTHYAASEISLCIPGYIEDLLELATVSGSAVNMINQINQLKGVEQVNDGVSAFDFINNRDPEAYAIFENFCKTIAYVIFNLQVTLDLEKIVIGGGISNQPIVVETISHYVNQLFEIHPVVQNTIFKPEITSSHFKSESNLYGALYNLLLKYQQVID